MPNFDTISVTRNVMAAAGPETWSRQPPVSATTIPPTIAVTSPTTGATPDAVAIASDSGSATKRHRDRRQRVGRQRGRPEHQPPFLDEVE